MSGDLSNPCDLGAARICHHWPGSWERSQAWPWLLFVGEKEQDGQVGAGE